MEKETFISKAQGSIISRFNEIGDFVKNKYNANIWFVEIMGKRHSYIAGYKEDSFLPPEIIYLDERYAVVSNEWEKIYEKEAILSLCKEILKEVKP